MAVLKTFQKDPFELNVDAVFVPKKKASEFNLNTESSLGTKNGRTYFILDEKDDRQFASRIAMIAKELLLGRIAVVPIENDYALSQEILLRNYEYDRFLSRKPHRLSEVNVLSDGLDVENVLRMVEATNYTRDLVNAPANEVYPEKLKDEALKLASQGIEVEVFDRKQIESMGMQAFLYVAKGSSKEPYFVRMSYKTEQPKLRIALVGKALTFDSGGLNLKTEEGMKDMKLDMAGAGALLGIMKGLTLFKPEVEVHAFFATCENMPDGNAMKPGDIVRAYNGKTIEILNTDAEGRLTLADVLSYVSKHYGFVDYIVDFATLTGAIIVALGEYKAGLFTENEKLKSYMIRFGEMEGEEYWHMPMDERLAQAMKSKVADVKNTAGFRWGGAISATMFLREFVDEPSKWAHVDIAGTSYSWTENKFKPFGATGFGVRTMLRWFIEMG